MKETKLSELIEKCIEVRGNRAYDGSYAAPREAFHKILTQAYDAGLEKGSKKEEAQKIVFEALGEASALFMSQECKGTEIVMPSGELARIGNDAVGKLASPAEGVKDHA